MDDDTRNLNQIPLREVTRLAFLEHLGLKFPSKHLVSKNPLDAKTQYKWEPQHVQRIVVIKLLEDSNADRSHEY